MTSGTLGNNRFSAQDLARLLLNNGYPRDKEKMVWAVSAAWAESNGIPTNVNPSNPNAIGLWQIEASAHPEFDRNQLKDPDYNCQAMRKVSADGTNRKPWVSSTAGQALYRGLAETGVMDVLRDPNAGLNGGDPGAAIGEGIPGDKGALSGTNILSKLNDVLGKFGDSEFWKRVGKVVGGFALVLLGLILLNKDLISSVIPAGRATKLATAVAG